jgi:sphingosine kinase
VGEPNKIDLRHIINAAISSTGLTITYVDIHNTKSAPVNALQYSVGADQEEQATLWAEHLLEMPYGPAQRRKRPKVLINSFCVSASSKYHKIAAPIFAAAHCDVDVEETRYRGHAGEIAETIDLDAYDAIVCCSGDGLQHEVFNGLERRADAVLALSSVAVAMFPWVGECNGLERLWYG